MVLTVMTEPGATEQEDGRRARRERNRDAVVDALLALYGEGNLQPSSDEIALRAGLSPRSLFRYFDDIDDLTRAAIARQQERIVPLARLDIDVTLPIEQRVAGLVAQRVALFEAMANVGLVSRLRAPFQQVVADELRQARAYLRHQLERLFAPELATMGAARAAAVVASLDALCSFETYRLLRDDQALSRKAATAALLEAVGRLVAIDR